MAHSSIGSISVLGGSKPELNFIFLLNTGSVFSVLPTSTVAAQCPHSPVSRTGLRPAQPSPPFPCLHAHLLSVAYVFSGRNVPKR